MLVPDSVALTVVLWLFIVFLGIIFFQFGVQRIVKHYVHYPIPAFAVRFIDNPLRRWFQPPARVVDWIDVREGMAVLEIGPGPGTFTFEAARRIGGSGRLVVLDIQPEIISRLETRIVAKGVSNTASVVASAHHFPFGDGVFDGVFMVSVLGEVVDKNMALREVKRVLKAGGMLSIGELLPDPDYPRRKTVIEWCGNAGLAHIDRHGSVLHYVLRFEKPDNRKENMEAVR